MHRKRNIFEYLDQCKTPDLEFQLVEYHEHHHERTEEHTFVLPLPSPPPVTASPQATLDLRKFLGMKKKTPSPRKKRVVKRKIDVKIPKLDTFFSSKD